jgi:hypothetical protein
MRCFAVACSFAVNLKTAKDIDLAFPETVLTRADRIIE